MVPDAEDAAINVGLLTGFLGSGKTTLLNRLLAHSDMELSAVIINEFGEVGLDHLVVQELDDDVVLLQSGCICCTVQGQLVEGLKELYLKRLTGEIPQFERLLIETTGIADPLPILDCLMRDPLFRRVYRVDTIITTVDALYGSAQLEQYGEALNQVAVADHLLVTKSDLTTEEAIAELVDGLRGINRRANITRVQFGDILPSLLFNSTSLEQERKRIDLLRVSRESASAQFHHHDVSTGSQHGTIRSFCIELATPIDWEVLKEWYTEFAEKRADDLLRVKGLLSVPDQARPYFIHCVRSTIHDPWPLPEWPDESRASRIVFITKGLDQSEIETSLRNRLEREGKPRRAVPRVIARGVRWLNREELSRIFATLAQSADFTAANALKLSLLTGVDINAAMSAHWEEFDLSARVWRQRVEARRLRPRSRQIVLHETAIVLLEAIHDADAIGGRLFPDDGSFAGRVSKAWETGCRLAGVEAPDIEQLPPTLATDVFTDVSDDLIKRLLGIDRQNARAAE
jgi:G3E family GTPase